MNPRVLRAPYAMSFPKRRVIGPALVINIVKITTRLVAMAVEIGLATVERRKQRRQLLALPDEILKDIGLTRVDVAREADKPFWR